MKTRNKTHPEVQKPPCFAPGFLIIALLRCLIRKRETPFGTPRVVSGKQLSAQRFHQRTAGRRYPLQDRLFPHIINILVTYGEQSAHHRPTTINNDRMGDGHPLCATSLLHRGNMGGLPRSIQSSQLYQRGERSTLRNMPPSLITPLRTLRR